MEKNKEEEARCQTCRHYRLYKLGDTEETVSCCEIDRCEYQPIKGIKKKGETT